MKRKVTFSIVLGAGVAVTIFFYGCFALKGEETHIEIESFLPPVFLYDSKGLRDPFIPLVTKEKIVVVEEEEKTKQKVEKPEPKIIVAPSGYRLIGLVWDKKGVFALIQGKEGKWIVKKGDRIGNFQVSKIEAKKGEVILVGKEKIVKLRMRK